MSRAGDPGDAPRRRRPAPEIVLRDGTRLHHVERGGASATPVVFVHLGGSDWRYWNGQLETFAAAGYRAVAYSRRFAMPNDNPMVGDYSPAVDADDLAELVEALGAAPAHLVAASAGAYAALLLATRRPELVRSLVLAEPPVMGWARTTRAGAAAVEAFMRDVWRAAGDAFRAGDPERGMRTLMDYFVAPGALDRFPPRLRRRVLENARDWEAHTTSTDPFPTLDRDAVRAIAAPVLLLSGDRTLPLHRLVDAELERLLTNVRRLTVEGASHDLWADAGDACRRVTLEFLKGASG
ncbi:MAG: alpha/beta fold hydrolase [Gemmatimonadaceae bacterium]